MATGAVLLEGDGNPREWACYSTGPNDVLIRKRSPTGWVEQRISFDEFNGLRSLTRSEMLAVDWPAGPFRPSDLRASDGSYPLWCDYLASLDRVSGTTRTNRVVPIGPLRKTYLDLTQGGALPQGGDERSVDEQVDSLAEAWRESIERMSPYDNAEEGWVDAQAERHALPEPPACLSDVHTDREFVAWVLESQGLALEGSGELTYEFVDREINPVRTRRSTREDGSSADASGRGGIDLLLVDAAGQPVVGEVKVRGDSDLRHALLQALAYASELATVNQMRRLRRWYPGAFGRVDPLNAKIGILILQVERPADPTRESTAELIAALNAAALPRLGKVTAVVNAGDDWRQVAGGSQDPTA